MVISFILHNLHIYILLKVYFSLFLKEYTLFCLFIYLFIFCNFVKSFTLHLQFHEHGTSA